MEKLLNQAKNFMELNPHYGYLIVAFALLIVSIGNFRNWDWAVSAADSKQRSWYNSWGRDNFRKIMGTIFLIGSLGASVAFYYSL